MIGWNRLSTSFIWSNVVFFAASLQSMFVCFHNLKHKQKKGGTVEVDCPFGEADWLQCWKWNSFPRFNARVVRFGFGFFRWHSSRWCILGHHIAFSRFRFCASFVRLAAPEKELLFAKFLRLGQSILDARRETPGSDRSVALCDTFCWMFASFFLFGCALVCLVMVADEKVDRN